MVKEESNKTPIKGKKNGRPEKVSQQLSYISRLNLMPWLIGYG
jgi:hypothetical protein